MNPAMIILILLLLGGFINKCDTENKMVKIERKMERLKQKKPKA